MRSPRDLDAPLAIIDKRRTEVNVAEVMHIIGDVEGQHCLIVDDLIDTAGTLVKAAEALLKQGAKSVRACATHAVLSGPAVERIENSEIEEVVVTNSIPLKDAADGCRRSSSFRWRRCLRRRSSRFTKMARSARYLFECRVSLEDLRHEKRYYDCSRNRAHRAARMKRAVCAWRAWRRQSCTAPGGDSVAVAVSPERSQQDPAQQYRP